MEVILDGKPFGTALEGDYLTDLLRSLSDKAIAPDRVLREVKINGVPYTEAEMGPASELTRDRIQHLDVETVATNEVAMHFLANANDYLTAIAASTEKVAELFRVNDEQEANESYLATLESLQLFLQVLQNTRQALKLDLKQAQVEGVSAEERLNRLSDLIQEMLSAQEQQDWILLAD
ncbi:MAG: hypothetical protein PVG60_04710, partial [Desulfarculaceae bacterium]